MSRKTTVELSCWPLYPRCTFVQKYTHWSYILCLWLCEYTVSSVIGRVYTTGPRYLMQVQHSLVDMRPQAEMAKLCEITGVKLIT